MSKEIKKQEAPKKTSPKKYEEKVKFDGTLEDMIKIAVKTKPVK